jgi:hypothetical protein
VAEGLAQACRDFLAAPDAGWRANSHMPGYLATEPDPFLDRLAEAIGALWSEDSAKAASPAKVLAK